MSERPPANPWATVSLLLALAPLAVFVLLVLVEAARHTSSETFDELFYASVPICGVAAVVCGIVALRRPGGRRQRLVGLTLGAAEVVATLLVVVGLATAFDTLGVA